MTSFSWLISFMILATFTHSYQLVYRMQDGQYRVVPTDDLPADASRIQFVEEEPTLDISTSRNIFRLGLQILDNVPNSRTNVLLSPTSISSCLDLLLLGARGDTRTELEKVLGSSNVRTAWTSLTLGSMLNRLWSRIQVNSANGLFVDPDTTIQQSYINISNLTYQLQVITTNFTDTINTRDVINTWVDSATNGTIQNLFEEPLDAATRVVVINALYFKADWEFPFLEDATKMNKFYVDETETLDIPMMALGAKLEYYKGKGFSMVALPYKGRTISMYLLLPDYAGLQTLKDTRKQLTVDTIEHILKNMSLKEVIVTLPKFRISSKFSLKQTLEQLGVKTVFDPAKADFGNMIVLNGTGNIFPTDILHAVDIEVTEKGTTAAAVTAVVFTKMAKITFRCNRPFYFFIRHKDTGLILFQGDVVRPIKVEN